MEGSSSRRKTPAAERPSDPRVQRQLELYMERLRLLQRDLDALDASRFDANAERLRARVQAERELIRELCDASGLAHPADLDDDGH